MTDTTRPPAGAKTLAGVMGGAALAAALMGALTSLEGKKNVGYRDIVGVATACRGSTGPGVVVGRIYTDAECDALDGGNAIRIASAVRICAPKIAGDPLVAATLLAYNVGPTAFCASTAARRFNAGDLRGGCNAIPLFNKAGGKVVQGLVNRRAYERALCLRGLGA